MQTKSDKKIKCYFLKIEDRMGHVKSVDLPFGISRHVHMLFRNSKVSKVRTSELK